MTSVKPIGSAVLLRVYSSLFLCVSSIGNFSRASVDLHFFNLDIHLLLPLNTVWCFYMFLIERGFASCRIRVRLSLEHVVSYSRDTPAVQAHGFDFHHSSNSSDDRIPNRLYFHWSARRSSDASSPASCPACLDISQGLKAWPPVCTASVIPIKLKTHLLKKDTSCLHYVEALWKLITLEARDH